MDNRGADWTDSRVPSGLGGCWYGVYPATVVDLQDPDGQGRVKVRLPWAPDNGDAAYEAWARMGTFMAGQDRGAWFIPDQGDEVIVAFAAGNPRHPIVVGALWNGRDAPPESMERSGQNNVKSITSRRGVKITMDDTTGAEVLKIETPGGHSVTLDDGGRSLALRDSSGNSVQMESSGVTISSAGKLTVNASLIEFNAGSVSVSSGMSRFSGVVQTDTTLTNCIVAASYTPGAGNIW